MEYPSLRGKAAIVTGAANGIGAAIARTLAASGVKLALIDFDAERLENVAQQCVKIAEKFGNPKPFTSVGDLTSDAIRQKFVNDTLKKFGHLDILVNNAGCMKDTSMFDATMENADKMFSLLLRAPYDMCRLATKSLVETKGCIVNIASISSHIPVFVNPVYHCAKAGILHLTRCIADELAPYSVRANSVSPGPIRTGIQNKCPTLEENLKLQEADGRNFSAFKRVGEPEEIGAVVAFLCSNQSSYMTGSDLIVDGGTLVKHL